MKSAAVLLFAVLAVVCYAAMFDNLKVDEILKNGKLRKKYFDCLMEDKDCTPGGNEMKKIVTLALKEDCGPCSEKQKVAAHKFIGFMAKKKPDLFKKLEKKYDPEGNYRKKHTDLPA